jgi:hypothetical protein
MRASRLGWSETSSLFVNRITLLLVILKWALNRRQRPKMRKASPMTTGTKHQPKELDQPPASKRRGATWIAVLCAGVLGLTAGCSTAGGGEGDGEASTASAAVKAAESSGAASSGASASPVKPSTASSGQSTDSSPTACTSRMLQELQKKFEGRSPSPGAPDVRIERCTNGYAHAFSPPTAGEQYFLQYLNGSWQEVAQGTGVACGDPDAGRALLRACTALGYGTTTVPQRISDPQVVADRLVHAWMRHDTSAANQLTRDGAPIAVLFSHQAPSAAPTPIPCRLFRLGQFACSYTLSPRAELTVIVAGGASAGYEVTGAEFGD